MKRNDLIVTSENCNSGVFFSNFNYQLQVKSNCIANIASTLSFLPHHEITVYTSFILYPNVVDNIWECTRYAIQLLKSEAAQFTLLRDIYSGFTIILSNHRYHPKGFSADYCYSANELTLFLFVIRTGQKKYFIDLFLTTQQQLKKTVLLIQKIEREGPRKRLFLNVGSVLIIHWH